MQAAITCLALGLAGLTASARAQVPGPESFAQEPRTPMELWSAIDYLVRTGQIKQAVPYLEKFMSTQLDDATLIEIRDKFGTGSSCGWRTIRRPASMRSRWSKD